MIRNQIDFILINNRYKNSIKSVKTFPGADPVVAKVNIRMKKLKTKNNSEKLDINKLRDENIPQKTKEQINHKLQQINRNNDDIENVNERWKNIQEAILSAGRENLMTTKRAKQTWMTDQILDFTEKRRAFKNKDNNKYRKLNRENKRRSKQLDTRTMRGIRSV